MVVLSDEAFINPTNNVLLRDDDLVSFIPMEAVSDKAGEITAPKLRKFREVKNGYTRFSNDDVIWAKITPCMQNGKCAVAGNLENGIGFGSTEFHVVRSKDKYRLLPDYIWSLLRLDHLRQAAQRYFIGSAGQQRVPSDFLENLQIPLPPLEIQSEIANRIKKINLEIAREREAAERKSFEIKAEIEALILGTKSIDKIL
jgi:type I restriction enzyme S subunit